MYVRKAALCTCLLLGVSSFKVPTVALDELLDPTQETLKHIQKAMTEVGMFAVQQGSSSAEHATALKELVSCIHSGAAGAHAQRVVLKDNTIRTTLATATNHSTSLPFDDDLSKRCPDFVTYSDSVRVGAAATGRAYARLLDRLDHEGEDGKDGAFETAVTEAENLEHFHVYARSSERRPGDEPTLQMHTDLGMFIVMTPPQYYDLRSLNAASQSVDSGFHLKLPNGDIVSPEFPPGSLVVMNGEGASAWVQSEVAKKLYAPPHQVVLPNNVAGLGRAWYGRMYLPPRESRKQDAPSVTFQQYWTDASAALIHAPSGVAALQHRVLLDQGNCSAGQLFCWMTCMPISDAGTCNVNDIQCKDPATGEVWQGKDATHHCKTCKLVCGKNSAMAASFSGGIVTLLVFISMSIFMQ